MEMTDGVTGRVLGGSRACSIGAERQVGFGGNLSHPARVALHMRGTKSLMQIVRERGACRTLIRTLHGHLTSSGDNVIPESTIAL